MVAVVVNREGAARVGGLVVVESSQRWARAGAAVPVWEEGAQVPRAGGVSSHRAAPVAVARAMDCMEVLGGQGAAEETGGAGGRKHAAPEAAEVATAATAL